MVLLDKLIAQGKNPRGFVGRVMIRIMNRAHSAITTWAFNKIVIRENSPVLDIGCGGGENIHRLTKMTARSDVYGVDYSQQAVETSILRNKEEVQSGRVTVCRGEVSALPFESEKFGTVTAVQTHYFWPDLPGDVKEIYRVLGKGGTLLIAAEIYKINYHMNNHTEDQQVKQLFLDAGFRAVEIHQNKSWRCYVGLK
ncbi:class I SAM-dependent methyltransferase [Paenibacillus donghaensis]|uniref:SAM-dependent methyltransferase n=1 Tax=Paenibacillus donghaensis TaxID=414771 RepID=A0A2Z2KAP9_9BACL|nr:class I SAM-dependent methyltransferase [Paenibacillus donghaensis]ASA20675.1 SAM-dependent methyltransferase [Paenibacillus donghaensis]